MFFTTIVYSQPLDLYDSLRAYFLFEGNADDRSGNGYHGIVNGAVLTTDRFRIENSAYYFDGVDDYIEVPDNGEISGMYELSISAWISVESFPANDPDRSPAALVSKWITTWNEDCYALSIYYNTRLLTAYNQDGYDSWGTLGNNHFATDSIKPHVWVQTAMVKRNDTAFLYINGQLSRFHVIANADYIESPLSTTIGAMYYDHFRGFNGSIDDVRIYDRALDSIEILKVYHNYGTCQTVVEVYDTIKVVDTNYVTVIDIIDVIDTVKIYDIITTYDTITIYDTITFIDTICEGGSTSGAI